MLLWCQFTPGSDPDWHRAPGAAAGPRGHDPALWSSWDESHATLSSFLYSNRSAEQKHEGKNEGSNIRELFTRGGLSITA